MEAGGSWWKLVEAGKVRGFLKVVGKIYQQKFTSFLLVVGVAGSCWMLLVVVAAHGLTHILLRSPKTLYGFC